MNHFSYFLWTFCKQCIPPFLPRTLHVSKKQEQNRSIKMNGEVNAALLCGAGAQVSDFLKRNEVIFRTSRVPVELWSCIPLLLQWVMKYIMHLSNFTASFTRTKSIFTARAHIDTSYKLDPGWECEILSFHGRLRRMNQEIGSVIKTLFETFHKSRIKRKGNQSWQNLLPKFQITFCNTLLYLL